MLVINGVPLQDYHYNVYTFMKLKSIDHSPNNLLRVFEIASLCPN